MAGAMGGFLAGSIVAKMVLDKTGWNSSVSSIQTDVKKLEVQTSTWGESIAGIAKTWGLAGIAIVGTVGNMIMKNAEYMDSLDEMSIRTGVSVEDLSSYKLVLDASGASLDSFAFGMKTLASKMADARNGNLAAIKTFGDLGIAFKNADGSLRPLNDVFLDMADRFKTMGDTPERAAAAVDALGRAGMALIPTLDLGREGIKRFTDKAKELGLVVSGEAAKSASDFKDKVGELKGALDGAIQKIVIQLLPALTEMVTKLVPVIEKLMDFLDKTKILQTEVDIFATKVGLLADAFDLFVKAIGTVGSAIAWLPGFKKDVEDTTPGVGLFAGIVKTVSDNMATGAIEAKRLAGGIRDLGNAAEVAGPPLEDLAANQKYCNLILDPAPGKVRDLGDALTKFAPTVDEVAYATEQMATDTAGALTASEQAWLNFKQEVGRAVADIVIECFRIPKGLDDALSELPPILGESLKAVYKIFQAFISQLIAKWITDLLTNTIVKKTAEAATTAAGSLATLGTATTTLAGTLSTFMTTIATGIATALVTLATAIATSAAIIAAAAPEILIAGAVAAAIYGMFAGVSALLGGGGGKSSDVTFWLKPMSERLQEIRDYLFIVLEGQHLGFMHDIMVDDNKCMWDLVYKGQSIIDILSDSNAKLQGILDRTGKAQAGAFVMSPMLMAVGEQAPRIPEIILPEPIYERNLQMAAAMGGGQPGGRPIELYINGEPVKFPMRENMRKIAIDLIPYMTKNEQLKIHPRSVRAF